MKKFLICLFCAIQCFSLPVLAEGKNTEYSWYCPHVTGNVQPTAGKELLFCREYSAYYLDCAHTDINDADKVVYLTFDAGYENGNIAKILDTLAEEKVLGAFFILGNLVNKSSDIVKRMAEEGHTVCNHTLSHKNMSQCSDDALLTELHALEEKYFDLTGQTLSHYYRPPEGRFSKNNLKCLSENGYKTVFWSFAYVDWNNGKQPDTEQAKQKILDNLHNGEVMLLHPTSSTNASILGDVIKELKSRGFRFGTLDELTGGAG